MRRSAATFIASLFVLAACGGEEEPAPMTSDYKTRYVAPPAETVDPGVEFVDVAAATGIDFVHVNGARGKKFLPETMGSGVGVFDYDGDGDQDLLFVQSQEWEPKDATMRLYRNDGGWKFTDVTKEAGLDVPCYGMGCAIADYDGDGDQDVYVTALGEDLLFRNEGARFERVADGPAGGVWTDADGVEHPSWSTGAAWFDADGDGDLDLFVLSYVRWTQETDLYGHVIEGIKAYTRPNLYEGDRPRLYLQNADGGFEDATEASGFADTAVAGKCMALCVDDFNGDGKMDVFVANDTVQNFLFLGRGGGKYKEVAVAAAVAYDDTGRARAAMGLDSVDFRNDGRVSIAIGNFSEEPVSLFTVSRTGSDAVLFADDAGKARIGQPTLLPLTFGLLMTDVDLDGWCDLVLANGHIEPSTTMLKPELKYEQSPQLFRNRGDGSFADVSIDAGASFQNRIVGRGLAAGDLDGDGDLDLVFTSCGGRPMVLRNDLQSENRALRVRLRQPGKNRDALGAVVTVTTGELRQRRVLRNGGSYLSQSEAVLTFGLGGRTEAEAVTVRWPDGTEQDFGPLAARAAPHLLERK